MYELCSFKYNNSGGYAKFFLVSLSHNNLENYYKTNFAMMQHHKYSLSDLENMLPWERDIYVDLLQQHIKEENDKIREQNRKKV